MSKPADNILFASIDSLPILDKKQATKEILLLDDSLSFWDDYRYTKMFPLMTKNGIKGVTGAVSNSKAGEFQWTTFTPKIIIDWFEDHVFPWLGTKARIMALITQPGVANNEHIDCEPSEIHTRQHKFRIVLQGKTSTLYWMTSNGNVYAPDTEKAFIMDGGWPHGMVNTTDEVKVTLALGAPWIGKDHYDDVTILQDRNDYVMSDDINHLWQTNK